MDQLYRSFSTAVYLIHNDLSIKPLYCAACDYIEAHYNLIISYALLLHGGSIHRIGNGR